MIISYYTHIKKQNRFQALQSEEKIINFDFNNIIKIFNLYIKKRIIINYRNNFINRNFKNKRRNSYFSNIIENLVINRENIEKNFNQEKTPLSKTIENYFINKYIK